jgi:CHAT domain-containing protein
LPGTEQEVRDLEAQFREAFNMAAPPLVLRKTEATKGAFVAAAPGRRFVHLATHGFFAAESETSALDAVRGSNPMRLDQVVSGRNPGVLSGVVFAGINGPPGGAVEGCLLTALEAADLNLRGAELVTLSACDTGGGRTAGGEGVLGLQRAFHVAGARTVVATQWGILDMPTHVLIREFYKRLWGKNQVSKADALRQAQLRMIQDWEEQRGQFSAFKYRGGVVPKRDGGPLPPYFWAAFTLSGDWR